VTPYPAEARAAGHAGARAIQVDTLLATVRRQIGATATSSEGSGSLRFESGMLFLDNAPALRAAGMNVDSMVEVVAARLRAVPCVARVDRPRDLSAADTAKDAVARRWLHQLADDAPVALVTTLEPYCVWGSGRYATHGQPSDLDAHVPLILWGRGVKQGVYAGRVATVDVAPTLARLLGLVPAERLDGRVLTEALRE
jgi:hypothetical protein